MSIEKLTLAVLLIAALAGPALAADKFTVDPTHTYPSIEFSHMGLSIWRGKFEKTKGNIVLDRAARTGTAEIVIETASLNFGLEEMNKYARSEDFFNVAKYPAATYKGALKFVGDSPRTVEGQLTLLGVTRPVQLTINTFKCMPHPMLKKEWCGADVEADVNRADFGMRRYVEADGGKIHLRIQVEALKQD